MKKLSFLFLLFWMNSTVAQDSLKISKSGNPILFAEGYVGLGGADAMGTIYGLSLNYQFFEKDLITIRYTGYKEYGSNALLLTPVTPFPYFVKTDEIEELGLLYGKRWVNRGHSWSISAGLSYSEMLYVERIDEANYWRERNTVGIPFEVNIKWFKNERKRFRAYYGLIPIGSQRVGFGRSFGFKIAGNISKANYVGFAINNGFGWHKKY